MQNNRSKSEDLASRERAVQDNAQRGFEDSEAREADDHCRLPQSNATGDREDTSNPKDGRGPLKKSPDQSK